MKSANFFFGIAVCFSVILLAGCYNKTSSQPNSCYTNTSEKWAACDTERGYTYWYPRWIEETKQVPNEIQVYTYNFPSSDLYSGSTATTCSPSISGASKTTSLLNAYGKAFWGKVNIWENMEAEGWDPLYPIDSSQVVCKPIAPHLYTLCADKDNKMVVICISQQTDNPALAEQIFSTFRWIK
jgi:hypothetical protein